MPLDHHEDGKGPHDIKKEQPVVERGLLLYQIVHFLWVNRES